MADKEKEELDGAIMTGISLEDSIVELKQLKAKFKSHFIKLRRWLLVTLQEKTVESERINSLCEELNSAEGEVLTRLSDKYREQKDSKMYVKLSQEIEQIEQEYTSAKNRAQQVLENRLLDLRPAYQQEDRGLRGQIQSVSNGQLSDSDLSRTDHRSNMFSGSDLISQDL